MEDCEDYDEPVNGKRKRKESPFLVTNQLIFGSTLANLGFDQYELFCEGANLKPSNRTYFHSFRARGLQEIQNTWEREKKKVRKVALALDDRDVEMDATFCQRRDAENCTVTLLSSKKRLVLASVVVSKTEEALPAIYVFDVKSNR